MEFNWIEIGGYILTIILGALSIYFKRSAAAQSKAAEVENWLAEIKGSADKYIAKAEKEFKGTQRGGEKFAWVVETLYMLLPVPVRAFITKEMIAEIVQGAFDAMAEYATAQLDKALSDKEG
jgi:hypothetical protein